MNEDDENCENNNVENNNVEMNEEVIPNGSESPISAQDTYNNLYAVANFSKPVDEVINADLEQENYSEVSPGLVKFWNFMKSTTGIIIFIALALFVVGLVIIMTFLKNPEAVGAVSKIAMMGGDRDWDDSVEVKAYEI